MKKRSMEVVAGIILKEKKILIAQRPEKDDLALLWEFPGGKVEKGETLFEALKREIKEELDMDIIPKKEIFKMHYEYPDKSIILHFIVASTDQDPKFIECKNAMFLDPQQLDNIDLAPADKAAWKKIREILKDEEKNVISD